MIGSLMWLMVWTRPDLVERINRLGQFSHNLALEHHSSVQIIFAYLAGTKEIGLYFGEGSSPILEIHSLNFHGYSDVAYANHLIDRKSTNEYLFKLANGLVS